MPRWITDEKGKWYPAKEKVALRNNSKESIVNPSATWSNHFGEEVGAGEPFIYEGPDRAALEQLFAEGNLEFLGNDWREDPYILDIVRERGYKDVETYAKAKGFNETKAKERFESLAAVTASHEITKKVEAIKKIGGGQDSSGQGNDAYGGFGVPPDR